MNIDKVNTICKIGCGHKCCRYLVMAPEGFECAKLTGMKEYLDARVASSTINARGDNCEGDVQEQ
jgi:hypothetical protein